MAVGRGLANASHLIRLYDTGKLRGQHFTYHVLQFIEGDTLDDLVGVTGTEHASVSRPPRARSSEREARLEYARAVRMSKGEVWCRARMKLTLPARAINGNSARFAYGRPVVARGCASNRLRHQ